MVLAVVTAWWLYFFKAFSVRYIYQSIYEHSMRSKIFFFNTIPGVGGWEFPWQSSGQDSTLSAGGWSSIPDQETKSNKQATQHHHKTNKNKTVTGEGETQGGDREGSERVRRQTDNIRKMSVTAGSELSISASLLLCILRFSIMKMFNEGIRLEYLLIFFPVLNLKVLYLIS